MSAELDASVALRHDLVRIIRSCLGLPETVAVPMADHLARELCRSRILTDWRAIPVAEERVAVHAAIAREYTGRNVEELMRKYNVSRATVFRAIPAEKSRQAKRAAILRDYNGRNVSELMAKHGVSRATVYNIVNAARESGTACRLSKKSQTGKK